MGTILYIVGIRSKLDKDDHFSLRDKYKISENINNVHFRLQPNYNDSQFLHCLKIVDYIRLPLEFFVIASGWDSV